MSIVEVNKVPPTYRATQFDGSDASEIETLIQGNTYDIIVTRTAERGVALVQPATFDTEGSLYGIVEKDDWVILTEGNEVGIMNDAEFHRWYRLKA